MMKRIITCGTFDLFHVGHVRILKRLKALGDEIYIACVTDEFNSAKGKKSIIHFEERIEILSCCHFVDRVLAEKDWHKRHRLLSNAAMKKGRRICIPRPFQFRSSDQIRFRSSP